MWRAYATVLDGWAMGVESSAAIARVSAGLAELEATGTALLRPHFLGLLAGMQAKAGQMDTALAVLAEAIERVRTSGEHWCEAELLRLRGEILSGVRGTSPSDALSSFKEAHDLARRQGALAWGVARS
jgi:predicted ATPase